MAEKQSFYHEYHVKSADKTTSHIIVAGFIGSEAMEGTIIRWMQNIFMKYRTFEVTLNNYSGFPPHEIYLRVQDCSAFLELSKDLQVINAYVSSCSCPPMKPISKPHVTIAGRLPEAIYFKALTQY